MSDIHERVLKTFKLVTGSNSWGDPILPSPSDDLRVDLALDSLDLFELALFLEEEFRVAINQQAIIQARTVQEVIDYVIGITASTTLLNKSHSRHHTACQPIHTAQKPG